MIRLWISVLAILAGLAGMAAADPMADLRSGNAAFKDGKYDEAVQAYTQAIMTGELGADALAVTFNNRGVAYGELGDFDRAILDYNEALALRPDDPTSIRNLRVGHVRRGGAAANLGEYDKAVADFTKAIELDPSHYQAYLRRGQVAMERGQLDAAIADLEKAQSLAPDNAQAGELLVRAHQLQAEAAEAVARKAAAAAAPPVAATPIAAAEAPTKPPAAEVPAAALMGEAPAAAPEPPATAAPEPPPAATSEPPPAVSTAAGPAPADARRVRAIQSVNMRAGPGNQFERVRVLQRGTQASVLGEQNGWIELALDGGRRGWVYERFLEPAAP